MAVVARGKEHFAIWDLRRVLWKTRALLATLGGIVDIRIVLGQDAHHGSSMQRTFRHTGSLQSSLEDQCF